MTYLARVDKQFKQNEKEEREEAKAQREAEAEIEKILVAIKGAKANAAQQHKIKLLEKANTERSTKIKSLQYQRSFRQQVSPQQAQQAQDR